MNMEEAMKAYVAKFGESPAREFTELLPEEELSELLRLALEAGEPLALGTLDEMEDAYCDHFHVNGYPVFCMMGMPDAHKAVKLAQAIVTDRKIECELPLPGDPNGPFPRF